MDIIPESHRDLVGPNSKAIAFLATTLFDGAPLISPVWFGVVDGRIAVYTSDSTLKVRNMQERPQVAVVLQDPEDQYRYVQIRGHYVEKVAGGTREFMDALSLRYIGKPYPRELGPDGVVLMIEASRVNVFSWDPG